MAWTYRIDLERRRVDSKLEGDFRSEDMREHMRALRDDPDFRADFDQLLDLSGVTDLTLTAADVREHVEESPFGAGSRRAIVASSDAVFGMARMYQILRANEKDEIEVFRTFEDARQWLGDDGEDTSEPPSDSI